jgi:TetR/AcrR family transcriptional regulator, mexCD-oprJ operon repressor
LLRGRRQPTIAAVASEAGVSRPTVYAHFPERGQLLEALVERTVRRAMAAIGSAEPERGPAIEALQRLVAASWKELASNAEIAHAAAGELSANAMRRAHETVRAVIRELVDRGRRDGSFRTDVPAAWLVTSCLALVHAAAEEVRAGELNSKAAHEALALTVADLLVTRTGS